MNNYVSTHTHFSAAVAVAVALSAQQRRTQNAVAGTVWMATENMWAYVFDSSIERANIRFKPEGDRLTLGLPTKASRQTRFLKSHKAKSVLRLRLLLRLRLHQHLHLHRTRPLRLRSLNPLNHSDPSRDVILNSHSSLIHSPGPGSHSRSPIHICSLCKFLPSLSSMHRHPLESFIYHYRQQSRF